MVIDIIKKRLEDFFDRDKSNTKVEGTFDKLFFTDCWNLETADSLYKQTV